MSARLLTSAALISALCGALPGMAADPQLLTLVMPDATVLAGVNVQQAITTPFGQYVLAQIQSQQQQQLQALITLTGFDPTQDVTELLVASDAAPAHTGLALARGTFPVAQIAAAATLEKAVTEKYSGVTILEDPKQTHGFAFPNGTLVIAGDIANVKAAIDRLKAPASLPAAVTVEVNHWSGANDAWVITTVPPSALHPPSSAPKVPGVGGQGAVAFQAIQSGAAGVKFGNVVTLTAQAQADNAADAESMAGVLQMLASMAQLQASSDPTAAALAQSLKISASGAAVNISVSLPEAQFEQLTQPKAAAHQRPTRRM